MGETDEELVAMKAYVPAYQKEQWRDHADELDMNQSEFVRTMVQAGRTAIERNAEDGRPSGSNPGGKTLESRILDTLDDGPKTFEEILTSITRNIEERVDERLHELQSEGEVTYSGRRGGYLLNGD